MRIRFFCPGCQRPARADAGQGLEWQCPACAHAVTFRRADADGTPLCPLCGNHELYRKKDFPHWLGLTILTLACLAFLAFKAVYRQWTAWAILIGSAVVDGVLYWAVGDVAVCYRCHAHVREFPRVANLPPHDLGLAERYRQERLRREQLSAEQRPPG
ncbi:MAG: hypothetical protein NZ700_01165 [Gemmataceae bacterium]|nr:hypothetical protein [Gemmataceae bacterium]MDW8264270.1 hypothetical protein [Gemmataceae bacterium]